MEFVRYIARFAPQYINDKKLIRYRSILSKILEKYCNTADPWLERLYSHQHSRIYRMAMKDYPDMIFTRW